MNDALDPATGQISDNSPVVTTGSISTVFITIVSDKRLIAKRILGFEALTTMNMKSVVCSDVGGRHGVASQKTGLFNGVSQLNGIKF
jgi:hypothetical protein